MALTEKIQDKVTLITGGTGSFGNTVINSLLKYNPKRIIIFSRDEKKQFDMRNFYNNRRLRFVIGNVKDKESVEEIMVGVDYVFHAAALKQVPTGEFFPMEIVKTNVIGTYNILHCAIQKNIKKVVILSTDKAAYPINAMGMSKALMEKIMIAESRNLINGREQKSKAQTVLCGVRYGNVLYTRGSVVPYFISQIKQGKTLTITSGRMTRFLISLEEAVDLVLYAFEKGENGHIYVRKSPACTLETLAKALCRLFKHKKGYREIGVRAGEKIHETLVTKEEMTRAIDLGCYFDIPCETQGLDYKRYFYQGEDFNIEKIQSLTSSNTQRLNVGQVEEILLNLPEVKAELKSFKQ